MKKIIAGCLMLALLLPVLILSGCIENVNPDSKNSAEFAQLDSFCKVIKVDDFSKTLVIDDVELLECNINNKIVTCLFRESMQRAGLSCDWGD